MKHGINEETSGSHRLQVRKSTSPPYPIHTTSLSFSVVSFSKQHVPLVSLRVKSTQFSFLYNFTSKDFLRKGTYFGRSSERTSKKPRFRAFSHGSDLVNGIREVSAHRANHRVGGHFGRCTTLPANVSRNRIEIVIIHGQ